MNGKLTYIDNKLEYTTGDAFVGFSNDEIDAINVLQKRFKLHLYTENKIERDISFSYRGGPFASFCNLLGD